MPLPYSDSAIQRSLQTLDSVAETIRRIIDWNNAIKSVDDFYSTQTGVQLLTANCTLITAIGEGINRINKLLPEFLDTNFQYTPWHAIIGMRNHIAHGYFELDADIIFEAVKNDIPGLLIIIEQAIRLLQYSSQQE